MSTYKWNYHNNKQLPNGTLIVANDDNLRGNVCYLDINNGISDFGSLSSGLLIVGYLYEIEDNTGADFTGVGAADNNVGTVFTAIGTAPIWGSGSLLVRDKTGDEEIGSANFPFSTLQQFIDDITYFSVLLCISAKGEHVIENITVSAAIGIFEDEKWTVRYTGSGGNFLLFAAASTINIYGGIIRGYTTLTDFNIVATYANFYGCIIDNPITAVDTAYNKLPSFYKCIVLGNVLGKQQYLPFMDCMFFNVDIAGQSSQPLQVFENCLFYNCNTEMYYTGATLKNIFWLGTFTYFYSVVASYTYDLSEAIGLLKSEATILSEMNALFGSSMTTANAGILEANFINTAKGNFGLDYLNHGDNVEALLDRMSAFSTELDVFFRGLKLEWDATEASNDYIFSATSPHYNANDGFGGLTCQNLNADGSIINTAYDALAVTKQFSLAQIAVLQYCNQFGIFGAGNFEWDEIYIRGVASGDIEDVYSIAEGYTCQYASNTVTCDLPRFYQNRELLCNKFDDAALNNVEKGAYDLDGGISFYAAFTKFQLIFVKRAA